MNTNTAPTPAAQPGQPGQPAPPPAQQLRTIGPRLQRALTRHGAELVAFGIEMDNKRSAMLRRQAVECERAAAHDSKRAERPERKKKERKK